MILNKHRHIFRRLKKQFKMLLHRQKSLYRALVITRYEQRSFVVASFFASTCTFHGPCPTFLGFNGPSMIRSFPLLQESSELWFRFCLHNFSTKCLSKVNLCHWMYKLIFFPVIKIQTSFGLILPTRYRQFSFKIFVRNHFSTE